MYYEFTPSGRWYVRNERGQIVTKHFDSFDELVSTL